MDIQYLRECIAYEPETGVMVWKVRPKEHFKTAKGYNLFKARFAGTLPGSYDSKGYLRIPIDGVVYRAHRLAWALHHGEHPKAQIDHINGDPADNRICNLRVTDNVGNSRNRKLRADNKSGYPGVAWRPDLKKWTATIGVGNISAKSLGAYETKDEAIAARRGAEAVLEYHENHGRHAS